MSVNNHLFRRMRCVLARLWKGGFSEAAVRLRIRGIVVWTPCLTLALAAAGALWVGAGCSTVDRNVWTPPQIEGATFVGDARCEECHAPITKLFPGSAHAQFRPPGQTTVGDSGCESCHGPGSLHVAAGGGKGVHILNPGKDPSTCFDCHGDIEMAFRLPHHHPVIEGQMNCVDCHDPHGQDIMKPAGGLGLARLNESCARCHREQARPVIFEHEAMREGCIVCHDPHGSFNDQLLVQRDANLCLKCHAQVQGGAVTGGQLFIGGTDHSFFLSQGTCWSAGCHPGVHGSNIHPRFHTR